VGGIEILRHRDRIRRVSDSLDESRRRGRLLCTLVLTDSVAPSPIGPIRIEEAWVEADLGTQLGILPRETGGELLVMRVETESSDAYFFVQGLDWPRDTIVVHKQRHSGPQVRYSYRRRQPPDTLRFLEPTPSRGW
jgi:hypothetical protein